MYLRLRQYDINKTGEKFALLKREIQNYADTIENAIRSRKTAYESLNKKVVNGGSPNDWQKIISVTNLLEDITNFIGKLKQEQINIGEKLRNISEVVRT